MSLCILACSCLLSVLGFIIACATLYDVILLYQSQPHPSDKNPPKPDPHTEDPPDPIKDRDSYSVVNNSDTYGILNTYSWSLSRFIPLALNLMQ